MFLTRQKAYCQKSILFLCMLAMLSTVSQIQGQNAFPGAQGYEADITSGGRGGVVMIVDRLDDDATSPAPGSLRHALNQTFPRTIVFKVAGYITLDAPLEITEDTDDVTIAGQTAPGDGITLRGAGLVIHEDARNVIVRHLRIRHGSRFGFIDDECDPSRTEPSL